MASKYPIEPIEDENLGLEEDIIRLDILQKLGIAQDATESNPKLLGLGEDMATQEVKL